MLKTTNAQRKSYIKPVRLHDSPMLCFSFSLSNISLMMAENGRNTQEVCCIFVVIIFFIEILRTFWSKLCKIHFNITFTSTPRSTKRPLQINEIYLYFKIPHKNVFVRCKLIVYLALPTLGRVKLARQVAGMGQHGIS